MDHADSKLGTNRSETSHLVSWKNEARFELICTAPLALEGRGLKANDTVYFTDPHTSFLHRQKFKLFIFISRTGTILVTPFYNGSFRPQTSDIRPPAFIHKGFTSGSLSVHSSLTLKSRPFRPPTSDLRLPASYYPQFTKTSPSYLPQLHFYHIFNTG